MDRTNKFYKLLQKKKYRTISIGPLLLLALIGAFFLLYSYVGSTKAITDVYISEIPEEVKEQMDAQLPDIVFSTRGFDWFDYYDLDRSDKIEVKYSGLSSSHYGTYAEKSFRYKDDNQEYRFKSLASEMSSQNAVQYEAFQELSAYNIISQFYSPSIKANLVRINQDNSKIMINWDQEFPNRIREKTFVEWVNLAKANYHAKDKQDRYIYHEWDKANQTKKSLDNDFIEMMNPIYDAIYKSPEDFEETTMDTDSYLEYFALGNLFGSGHMDSHNLMFVPEYKKDEDPIWRMAPFDMAGMKYFNQPIIMQSVNPMSQYFLRQPRLAKRYQEKLYELNDRIFEKGFVESYVDSIRCSKLIKYDGFADLVQKSVVENKEVLDINSFCKYQDKVASFGKMRSPHLKSEFMNSSFHWWLVEDEDSQYIYIRVPTEVGVQVDKVKCGNRNCKNKLELINKPYWYENDLELLPEFVRPDTKWRAPLVPSKYIYKFKILSDKKYRSDELSLEGENIITGDRVYGVRSVYPTIDVEVESLDDNKYNLKLIVVNPAEDSEYFLKDPDPDALQTDEEPDNDLSYRISSSCKLSESDSDEYLLDCSAPSLGRWPYALTYNIDLFYDKFQIATLPGEVYIDGIKLEKNNRDLNIDTIKNYKVGIDEVQNNQDLQAKVNDIITNSNSDEILYLLNNADNIYFLNPDSHYEISDDLVLGENDVLWMQKNSKIHMWPLVNLDVGTLILSGEEEGTITIQTINSTGYWNRLMINNGFYSNYSSILNGASQEGGIYAQDSEVLILNSDMNLRYGFVCESCNITVKDSKLVSGEVGFRIKDSISDVSNVQVLDALNPFIIEDTVGVFDSIEIINAVTLAADSAFEVLGPATYVKITNIDGNNTNIFMTKRGDPLVEYNNINLTGLNKMIIDLDSQEMYKKYKYMSEEEFEKRYPFVDRVGKNEYIINPGKYIIENDILIPYGFKLTIMPGTTFNFNKKRGMLSYGEIVAKGTEKRPIKFDANGKKWGVLLLLGPGAKGEFDYVEFDDAGEKYFNGFKYTGGLSTDHALSLRVTNSYFQDSNGDDALNCKYTKCFISNNLFKDNKFDAIDLDFSEGVVQDNEFIDNGNDSIDLSFDESLILENKIENSGDKGISIGENSNTILKDNVIKESKIGIEVKDNSQVTSEGDLIEDNDLAISTYQKKRTFGGGGKITLTETELVDNDLDTYSDIWTSIEFSDNKD